MELKELKSKEEPKESVLTFGLVLWLIGTILWSSFYTVPLTKGKPILQSTFNMTDAESTKLLELFIYFIKNNLENYKNYSI